MTESASRAGMTLLRVGAVVLALGAGAFLVHKAHTDANSDEPKKTQEATPKETLTDKEAFMRSSKSLSFDEDLVEIEEPKDDKEPVFLPSSKGTIGIVGPEFKGRGAKQEQKKQKAKEPVFLPSSKSMPPPTKQKNDG